MTAPETIPPAWLADYRDAVARCESVGLLVMVLLAHLRILLGAYATATRAHANEETSQ